MSDSFVSTDKQAQLAEKMRKLGIWEADLVEKFILGSGHGGQKLNKTSSCVYLRHAPSGIEVKCQSTRSRSLNRFVARRELCDKLEERLLGAQSARQKEAEKIRRQKRRRSRRQKQTMLEHKHRQSEKKQHRTRVSALEF